MSERFYTDVLTRGNSILYRGYDENGKQIKERIDYNPAYFVPTHKDTKYKTLDGIHVEKIRTGSVREAMDFFKQYSGVGGMEIYGDINYQYQYIGEEFRGEINYDIEKIRVLTIDIETTTEHGFPDMENPIEEINAITIKMDGEVYSFGVGDFDVMGVHCHPCSSESELIEQFLDLWEELKPDIVTGWHIRFFDIPYLHNRIEYVMNKKTAKRLSPWGVVKEVQIHRQNRIQKVFNIYGIAVMDYLDLYSMFTYVNQESYSLNHISYVELGEKKLSYDEYDSITEFYKNDFQKFMEYNIKDVDLVYRLEEKLKLMELAIALAYSAKVNFEDIFSQVKTWDCIIYHYLLEHNIIIPPRKVEHKATKYEGAYVMEPITGMHDWVMSFDLNSLYPHLIMQYNISTETKLTNFNNAPTRSTISVDGILNENEFTLERMTPWREANLSIAANGVLFDNSYKGFLPSLMERLYEERKISKGNMIEAQKQKEELLKGGPPAGMSRAGLNKKLTNDIAKYKNQQLVRKVQLNSAYGAIGNQYCRYYDVEIAEAVTISGQLSIRWIENELNTFLNETFKTEDYVYVIASDTDSVYIRFGDIIEKVCPDKTTQEKVDFLNKCASGIIEPFITKKYDELADKMNAFANKMFMKREVIADKGIWTAKKRYILNVLDNEGVRYEEPKIKVTGIETTRASTPEIVRKELKKAINLILTTDEDTVIDFIDEFKERFFALPPEDIAFPRGIRGLAKYKDGTRIYASGTPIATKGALIYNNIIKQKKLGKKLKMIRENDKAKFVYLKIPNPIKERVITFPNGLPKEFELEDYVDYEMQFERGFLRPLEMILKTIGWQNERKSNLEDLFC